MLHRYPLYLCSLPYFLQINSEKIKNPMQRGLKEKTNYELATVISVSDGST